MNEIINKINELTSNKPLIFFCREAERAFGIESLIGNYHICCIEDDHFYQNYSSSGKSIFSLEAVGEKLNNKNTANLIKHQRTISWIESIGGHNGFYAMVFKPTSVTKFLIEKIGGTFLGNDDKITSYLENKINIYNFFDDNDIPTPQAMIGDIEQFEYNNIVHTLGEQIVIQTPRGHTGNGTYFVNNQNQFDDIVNLQRGNKVKISCMVKGIPLTLNVCLYNGGVYIGPMQYQITSIPDEVSTYGVTIGNDFSRGTNIIKNMGEQQLKELVIKINSLSKSIYLSGYRGLFGIDMILDISDNKFFIIEINARQTANIPFETILGLIQKTDYIPLQIMNIAEFLGINHLITNYHHFANLEGSQIFIRSSKDFTQRMDYSGGTYRLQSDNAAKDFTQGNNPELREHVIYLDEDGDKPLIQKDNAYKLDSTTHGGFLLMGKKVGNRMPRLDEIARLQFLNTSLDKKDKIKPWIIEIYKTLAK